MQQIEIPARVLPPKDTYLFVKQVDHPATNSVSLRYAALWALGARDSLPQESLIFLEEWCRKHHAECQLFPNPKKLESLSFTNRMKDCPEAAENVASYPGNKKSGIPSYSETYQLVWIDQKWPELCRVLAGHRP